MKIRKKYIFKHVLMCMILICGLLCKESIRVSAYDYSEVQSVKITQSGQVIDSITVNGKTVYAVYRPYDGTNGGDSYYSCAAFVKRFYSEIYGISVYNLSGTTYVPKDESGNGTFSAVSSPQIGDIVRDNSSTHWAIVKEVRANGDVVIIQQNTWGDNRTTGLVGVLVKAGDSTVTFFRHSSLYNITSEFPLVNNGIYKIRNVNSGKVLEVPNASTDGGVQLQQYDDNGGSHQLWKAIQCADGYSFVAVHSGKAMDLYGATTATGGKITHCAYHGGDNQRFKLVHRGNGYYSIHPVTSNLAVDVYGYSTDNGALIYQYAYHGDPNQLFTFEAVDTTAPTISNIQVSDVTRDGYTVTCNVTDNTGVARVCFPTWTDANGQDDLNGDWYNTAAVYSPISGNTYSFRVNVSNHNYEGGTYTTHVWAYDAVGNSSSGGISTTINRDIALQSFTLSTNNINLNINQTQQLSVTSYTPSDTTVDKTATWQSSDSTVATVDAQGNVRALKAGTVTITCTVAGKTQTCTVNVANVTVEEFGEWSESLPDAVTSNPNLFEVQQKTQYRSSNRSETISTQPNLSGWTLMNEWWGDWQSCGSDVVGTATREVSTEQQYVKTQYNYSHWHNYSNGNTSPVQYSGWTYEETGWLDYQLTAKGTSSAGGTKYSAGSTQLGPCGYTAYWYNETKQDVYNTLYYYRDKYFQYYQWSDWSAWTDNAIAASDTVNVQTRTIYRYRYNGINVTTQPVNQTVKENATASFGVSATGKNLSYQWQVSKDNGKSWSNTTLTGNATANLNVEGNAGRNGYQFRCVIKDETGNSITTDAVTLTVLANAKIISQPVSQSVKVGTTATFTVKATGNELTYQWQVSKDNGQNWSNTDLTGNTTATLKVVGSEAVNGYQFRCVIKDANGNTVTSNAAKLTVSEAVTESLAKITKQPSSQKANEGKTVTFTVKTSGNGLTYQWQVSKNNGKKWSDSSLTGSKTSKLKVKATKGRNGYQFRCIVKDTNGNTITSNAVKLTVTSNVKITKQPSSQKVNEGKTATFTVKASGTKLTYQWQVSKDNGKKWSNTSLNGSKTSKLKVKATEERNGYKFRCIIKDKNGKKVTSKAVKLTVTTNAKATKYASNLETDNTTTTNENIEIIEEIIENSVSSNDISVSSGDSLSE